MAETALRVTEPCPQVLPPEAALTPRLAREWLAALDGGGRSAAGPSHDILGTMTTERIVLTDIADRLVSILFGTPFEPEAAELAGRAMVAAGFTDGDVLGRSLRVLMLWLPSAIERGAPGVPSGLAYPLAGGLTRRLADVTGAFADGYARGLRDQAVAEQETLRRAELNAERLLSRQLRHQAMHDPLTGLPNRTAIFGRLAAALASEPGTRVGLCYLDLDGFKTVNDTQGHAAGDQLLAVIAERFGRAARARGAVAARIGGDEFIVLAERSPGPDDLVALASALMAEARRPVALPAGAVNVSTCAGIVERPAGTTAETVVAAADAALYDAKSRGAGQWSVGFG